MKNLVKDWRALFYATMILVGVVGFGNALIQNLLDEAKSEKIRNQQYPKMTYDEMLRQQQQISSLIGRGAQTPEEYFRINQQLSFLKGSANRARDEGAEYYKGVRVGQGLAVDVVSLTFLQNQWTSPEVSRRLLGKFGEAAWEKASKDYPDPELQILNSSVGDSDFFGSLYWWAVAQLAVVPFMFGHLWIKVRDEDGSVLLEFLGNPPVFILAILVWEVGLFKYKITSPAKQLLRASKFVLRFAAFVLSAGLSLFVCTGKMAKAESEDGSGNGGGDQTTQVISTTIATNFLSKYVGTFGGAVFHDAAIQTFEVTFTYKPSGWYLDIWDSTPLGQRNIAPNFAKETDFTIGKLGKVTGLGLDYNIYLSYLNVFPRTTLPRGDDLNFSATFSKSFALSQRQAITPYVRFAEAFPAKGSDPKEGRFLFFGIQQDRKIFGKLSVHSDGAFAKDSGAFGFNPGWIASLNGALNWKVGKHATIMLPTFQTSTPITDTHDGRMLEGVVGAGFAYSW